MDAQAAADHDPYRVLCAGRWRVPVWLGILVVLGSDESDLTAKPDDWGLQDPRRPAYSIDPDDPFPMPPELVGVNLLAQSDADATARAPAAFAATRTPATRTANTHCGSAAPTATAVTRLPATRTRPTSHPRATRNSGRRPPTRFGSYTLLNHESPEFIRFVNPGDLRVAHISLRHRQLPRQGSAAEPQEMMTHGCMLWGAALYNNGAVPFKQARFGESYSMNGAPLRLADGAAADRM